ncbi:MULTISPECIES: serine/threonine-protein kinase [Okeania]|uniref:non-specific serine/threonine protein kinase n=1 Tax=Okeania hirsuta TaxID=1458930 RepID=A0A3N6PHG9_9CYAN|nr:MULTISPECIES: serine/threonine-protein kinase [Okeania]NET11991.1 serine/threonine protein kinase [Okeania sp. SIO1H6]NES76937.1 serine/threonine protein kinase [Okeania sp. SIO1H4]NES89334.1 serine/threonine protein kinase [Okeania sp. SIO2B9]NET20638.1 serine/threonine protein kinase [Okeania sp. SIO1H5]NET92495.1 serine/threonine protein kinase [Okeania sp. SIO1H2]
MTLHQPNDIIAQRYRIVTALGQGGMGITYEAEDLTNYRRVALKAVSFQQAKDWKILELFEREAKVIANLHHPQIPKYLNYFYIDTEQDRCFYLVRELVWGNSLATWVIKGWHPTEIQVKNIGIQILNILSYLHQLNPPIIHRDIKPENIILQPDGQVFLVDFGAVKDIYRQTMSFSGTFVGTIGYMPPEQLQGKAYYASDLYSLGGTLLYLLTHRSPDELPQKRMKIDFRSCVKISPEFTDWLEVILEPMWEDRFQSATAALNVLSKKSEIVYDDYYTVKYPNKRPLKSRITLEKKSTSLIIKIPAQSIIVNLLVICLFIHIVNIGISLISKEFPFNPIILICFFITCFQLSMFSSKIHLQIYPNEYWIKQKNRMFSRRSRGKTSDIIEGRKILPFGYGVSKREQEWLVTEIRDFIRQLKSQESREKLDKKILD